MQEKELINIFQTPILDISEFLQWSTVHEDKGYCLSPLQMRDVETVKMV